MCTRATRQHGAAFPAVAERPVLKLIMARTRLACAVYLVNGVYNYRRREVLTNTKAVFTADQLNSTARTAANQLRDAGARDQ